MKATDSFKGIIDAHLKKIAAADALFAETLKKPHKSIDGCINYIFSEVKKSGFNGFADEEIFAMAIHYFDEDIIKDVAKVNGKVVVNHHIAADPNPKAGQTPEKKKVAKAEKPKAPVSQLGLF
ncbi:MAG: PcfK-like family protein [Sphingobacteriaceae bacterium]|nr:PcfK-like family protein [Sphingobacteriaceae bacterium]